METLVEDYPRYQVEEKLQALIDMNVVTVEDGEKTSSELLLEILEVLSPDEAVQMQELESTEQQLVLLGSIVEKIDLLNTTLQENHSEMMMMEEQGQALQVEGTHFMGLAVIIALAVYMFWNQLSKW